MKYIFCRCRGKIKYSNCMFWTHSQLSTLLRWLNPYDQSPGKQGSLEEVPLAWVGYQFPWRWFRQPPGTCLQWVMACLSEGKGQSAGKASLPVSVLLTVPGGADHPGTSCPRWASPAEGHRSFSVPPFSSHEPGQLHGPSCLSFS